MDIHEQIILAAPSSIKHLGNMYPFQLKEQKELMKENMGLFSACIVACIKIFRFYFSLISLSPRNFLENVPFTFFRL